MRILGQFLKKWKICLQNLTKEWKQPPVVILQQANFYNIFILCLQMRIIRRSDQGAQLMSFPSQIFFNDINHGYKTASLKKNSLWLLSIYMDVASYCYYEKGGTTNACSLSIFVLFQLQSCIILKRVIFEKVMVNIFNNCIAGSLNNNFFL